MVSLIAVAETSQALCVTWLSFAGRPILLRTNAPRLARYVRDFIPRLEDFSFPAAAEITLMVRDLEEPSRAGTPWFRARSQFAIARFTTADALWFNLRTREVFGSFSASLAQDSEYWRGTIFPTLLGILSASMEIAPVHAACLVHRTGGVLLSGYSGAGKSTLTVALARRGYALLSDEWTYLATAGSKATGGSTDSANDTGQIEAWSIPVPVKLLPDSDRFFPELLQYRTGISLNGEEAYEVNPEECFGISRKLRCRIASLVLIERSPDRGSSIVPIPPKEALDHLIAELEPLTGILAAGYERQIELIRGLGDIPSYRLSFNDHPDAVAQALDDALFVNN